MADCGLREMKCNSLVSDNCPVCALCGSLEKLRLCAGCKDSFYCSKEHQKSDWKKHKTVCKQAIHVRTVHDSCACSTAGNSVTDNSTENGACGHASTRSQAGNDPISKASREHQVDQTLDQQKGTNVDKADIVEENHQEVNESTMTGFNHTLQPTNSVNKTRSSRIGHRGKGRYRGKGKGMAPPTEETPSEETKTLANYVVRCMNDYGICVVDNFMGLEKGDLIYDEIAELQEAGVFKDGQLVSASGTKIGGSDKIRGDQITWIEKGDEGNESISFLIHRLDSLMVTCNGKLGKYDISGRTKAMVACYPGAGTGYMRHVDNPGGDGRCVTCIYYLNKDWDVVKDGGLLRIFPAQFNQVADIEPRFDRLLFFWSDRRNPHEVQPAHKTRYAITVWYFDREERERAKQKFLTQVAGKENSNKRPEGDMKAPYQ